MMLTSVKRQICVKSALLLLCFHGLLDLLRSFKKSGGVSVQLLLVSSKVDQHTPGDLILSTKFQSCKPNFHGREALFRPGINEMSTLKQPNQEKGQLHLHIYKNGGTSIIKHHRRSGGTRYSRNKYTQEELKAVLYNSTAWFRYALVRHPVSRAVSGYHEIKTRKCGQNCWSEELSPKEVLKRQIEELRFFLQTLRSEGKWTHAIPYNPHMWLQVSFLYNEQHHPYPLDYIGRFEDFEAELRYINANDTFEIGHSRVHPSFQGKMRDTDLPDDVLLLICDIYENDFCCLGYGFPNVCRPTDRCSASPTFVGERIGARR